MADYYPLLARAVTGLQPSTAAARRAIYDRARGALLGQLRGIKPPLPAHDIERESEALEAAVQRLEDELTVAASAEARRSRRNTARQERSPAEIGERSEPLDDQPEGDRRAGGDADRRPDGAHARGAQRSRVGRQRIEPTHPAAPTPPILRESKARFWIVGFTIVAVVAIIGVTAYFMRDRPEDVAKIVPVARSLDPTAGSSKIVARAGPDSSAPATSPLPSVSVETVPIQVPPAAEPITPAANANQSPPRPAPQSRAPTATKAQPDPPAANAPSGASPTVPLATLPPASSTKGADALVPAVASNLPRSVADTQGGATGRPPPPQTELPVTYRAALLVQAPETPERVKTFVGTVVWRTENVPGEAGQPLGVAVAADIDIPTAKLKVSMGLQKNADAALSASHTMTFSFIVPADGIIKGVRSISMPQMRADGAPGGEDLSGIGIVPITPTYFLVGLKQDPAAIKQNFDLLSGRNWIDLQFVLDDGKAAKITFEKGAQGGKVLSAATDKWK